MDGKDGTCAQVTRGCQCRLASTEFQLALLGSVHQALETAVLFDAINQLQVPDLACAQLRVLAANILYDTAALAGYGPLRIYDPRYLEKVDQSLIWLPLVHARAISCDLETAIGFPAAFDVFVTLKQSIINSQNFRPPLEP